MITTSHLRTISPEVEAMRPRVFNANLHTRCLRAYCRSFASQSSAVTKFSLSASAKTPKVTCPVIALSTRKKNIANVQLGQISPGDQKLYTTPTAESTWREYPSCRDSSFSRLYCMARGPKLHGQFTSNTL